MQVNAPLLPLEIHGVDVANLAIDQCKTAQDFRLKSLELLALKDIYILAGSIEDEHIADSIKAANRLMLQDCFCSGTLGTFSRAMLERARSASSEYEADYFYTLCLASDTVQQSGSYQAVVSAFKLFQADRSKEAQIVKEHIQSITQQMKRSLS